MSSIGWRLQEERKRLQMNQTAFAAVGGVLKGAQVNYEADKRAPDAAYLAALAAEGVDVLYVLTGSRQPLQASEPDPFESLLLQGYRGADAHGKAALISLATKAGLGEVSESAPWTEADRQRLADAELWRAIAVGLPTTPGVDPDSPISLNQFVSIVNRTFAHAKAREADEDAKKALDIDAGRARRSRARV